MPPDEKQRVAFLRRKIEKFFRTRQQFVAAELACRVPAQKILRQRKAVRFVDRSSVIKGAAFLYRFYHRFVVIRGGARVGYPARLFSRQAENFVIVVADLFYYPAFAPLVL